ATIEQQKGLTFVAHALDGVNVDIDWQFRFIHRQAVLVFRVPQPARPRLIDRRIIIISRRAEGAGDPSSRLPLPRILYAVLPREFAIDVVRQLRSAGYEALWAGGCVRDQLLGREPKD